jgi:hypothetical protein
MTVLLDEFIARWRRCSQAREADAHRHGALDQDRGHTMCQRRPRGSVDPALFRMTRGENGGD